MKESEKMAKPRHSRTKAMSSTADDEKSPRADRYSESYNLKQQENSSAQSRPESSLVNDVLVENR